MNEKLNDFIQENGIKINGLEKMPELKLSNVMFENPWDLEDESLYVAPAMKLTMSKQPDGSIHPLNKVSMSYALVQHDEALLGALNAIYAGMPEFGTPNIELSFQQNGGRMLAKIKSDKGIEIAEKDIIFPQLMMSNSADLSKRFTLAFGALRMVCTNGMVIPDKRFSENDESLNIKKLHKEGTLNLDTILQSMVSVGQNLTQAISVWENYTKKAITRVEMENIVEGIMPPTHYKEMLEMEIRGGSGNLDQAFQTGTTTAWNAYNAITQYLTDNGKNEDTAIDRSRQISERFDDLLKL